MKVVTPKVLFDTSIQFERTKYPEFEQIIIDHLKSIPELAGYKVYYPTYTLYEFRTGLIKVLIDFYLHVDFFKDVSKATAHISDYYGRSPKHILIITSVMARINKSIQTGDVNKYLRQLAVAILHIDEFFYKLVSGPAGKYPANSITQFKLKSSKDFIPFYTLLQKTKFISLKDFWISNASSLDILTKSKPLKSKHSTLHSRLAKISKNNVICDKRVKVNNVGDAVIAVDYSTETLLTTDDSFDILCLELNKKHIKFEKLKFPKLKFP